ncbi:MAG TPA: hypothetical protein DCK95_03440 [Anaerolineaceae bacterium]|nr:hypothetical protein [Anaerolineaceae bacterium]
MAKTFYTERDVEDLHRQGIMTITLTDEIVMTDLAYEKARRLEMKMVQAEETPPAAPIRPYINTPAKTVASITTNTAPTNTVDASRVATIKARVRETVKARLGSNVDGAMLDAVIERVAKDLGLG